MIMEKRISGQRAVWREFSEYSAMHGLPDIHRTWQRIFWRVFYVLFTTSAAIMCVLNVFYVFVDFASWPTTTKLQLLHATNADFPAVTFCNMNMLRYVKIDLNIPNNDGVLHHSG